MEAITYKQLAKLIPVDTSYEPREQHPRMQSIVAAFMRLNGFYKGHEYNPHNVRAWAIHNEFGLLCIAIGSHVSEALDNAADNDALDCCHVPYDELEDDQVKQLENGEGVDDLTHLGNDSALYDLTYISIRELD